MHRYLAFVCYIFFVGITSVVCAKTTTENSDVVMPHTEVLAYAKDLIKQGHLDDAKKALLLKPYNKKELEIERLYLLAQIATMEKRYDDAIDIYYYILNYEPNIPKIRFLLAELYLNQESWFRADYYYRSALASKELPDDIQDRVLKAIYYIRQNKNWNVWVNFGIAPDNNINNASSGEQCVMTELGIVCNTLDSPDKSVGFNFSAGGDYEFKLSDHWRFRNEFVAYTSTYDDKEYNDVYLAYAGGAKYVYQFGDIFAGVTTSKRFVGNKSYNKSIGVRLDMNHDFTQKMTGNFQAYYSPTFYDSYKMLDGNLTGTRTRLIYSFDASKYLVLRAGFEHEKTKDKTYTNNKINYAIGFGSELMYGFHAYIEPSVVHTNYQGKRWTVKNLDFKKVKEKDITKRISISLSNRNISFWGMMPVLTYSYTRKDSNIWQREYHKSAIELSVTKRF
ncbi:MAG: DUF560 domain-containing protein [Alphaproteobacteria bacterium]|nr:DUF560 domain-containing protein [Alphaproteobacteria bacterium]